MDSARTEQIDPPASPDEHAPDHASGPPEPAPQVVSSRPGSEAETTLVAVPVDPHVVQCQWEISPDDIKSAQRALGVGEKEFWPVLQFYDVTDSALGETPREPSFAIDVQLQAENWFVRSCGPDRDYRADLALKAEDGSFKVIASSNPVHTPPSATSPQTDEHWLPIRLAPQQPESAAPVHLPIDMREEVRIKLDALYREQEPEVSEPPVPSPSSLPFEMREKMAAPPVHLPIDMREEVHSKLDALYTERERELPEPPLPIQTPLPIDMQEEVRELFTHLYPGLEAQPPAPTGSSLFKEAISIPRVFREFHAVFPATKPSAIVDLTERNERSFTSGISSRTK